MVRVQFCLVLYSAQPMLTEIGFSASQVFVSVTAEDPKAFTQSAGFRLCYRLSNTMGIKATT